MGRGHEFVVFDAGVDQRCRVGDIPSGCWGLLDPLKGETGGKVSQGKTDWKAEYNSPHAYMPTDVAMHQPSTRVVC